MRKEFTIISFCIAIFFTDLRPPNSPDLNPVDYMMWGVVEQHVYHSRVYTVDKLKVKIKVKQSTCIAPCMVYKPL